MLPGTPVVGFGLLVCSFGVEFPSSWNGRATSNHDEKVRPSPSARKLRLRSPVWCNHEGSTRLPMGWAKTPLVPSLKPFLGWKDHACTLPPIDPAAYAGLAEPLTAMSLKTRLKRLIPFRSELRRGWNRIRPLPPLTLQGYSGPDRPSPHGSPVEPDNLLEQLGKTHQPTKCLHDYLKYYHLHFQGVRLRVRAVLEIGVDSGKSLSLWEEYFPNATIHGLDVEGHCRRFAGGRRKVHIGDAADPGCLESVLRHEPEGFDIVIDDGSHRMEHQLVAFNYLLPRLNSHAIYAIEDTGPCVGDDGLRVVRRVASLIPGIYDWPDTMPRPWPPDWTLPRKNFMSHFPEPDHWADRNIIGISFYRWLAIVNRGRNPGDNRYFYGE